MNRNILLVEPPMGNKYPPLGLMKLAAYHGSHGRKDKVRFIKGVPREPSWQEWERDVSNRFDPRDSTKSPWYFTWDRVYITTLFSFDYKLIVDTVEAAIKLANDHSAKVFVGGIAASLMYERFLHEPRIKGARIIPGLLSDAPAVSLQLDEFWEDYGAEDRQGTPIEDLIPDYSILDQIDYKYPVSDAYFAYASRGCVRRCDFCGVPKLEGELRDAGSLTQLIRGVAERHGEKRDLMLMDNNVVASPNFANIIAEIRDNGFQRGAKLTRGKSTVQRRVDFNQGVDTRILSKDEMYLREIATIAIQPLRIAFDHLGLRKPYEKAVRMAHAAGLADLSNYLLYNFHDTKADLYERMRINIELNEELGLRIFSFPMRYQPIDRPDRGHIGEHWTRYTLRSMQIMLQATRGIVSGSPDYFRFAFGESEEHFQDLLLWPQHYLFNRQWYTQHGGRPEFDEWKSAFSKMTPTERAELDALLSSVAPSEFAGLIGQAEHPRVNSLLAYYVPLDEEVELDIWTRMADVRKAPVPILDMPEDQIVEDAAAAV